MTAHPFRQSLLLKGVTHGAAPIPLATRIGNMIFSSGVMGKDPATDKVAPELDAQVRFAFQHMKHLVELGGGTLANIAHVTVFVTDDGPRKLINDEWIRLFPDENDRPARHMLVYELQHGMQLQLEFIAVLGEIED